MIASILAWILLILLRAWIVSAFADDVLRGLDLSTAHAPGFWTAVGLVLILDTLFPAPAVSQVRAASADQKES